MTPTHLRIYLQCQQCCAETVHDLSYAGRLLVDARCTACGRTMSLSSDALLRDYLGDLAHRVSTKPYRLAVKARSHPLNLLRQMPVATLRQPRKLLNEAKVVVAHYRNRGDQPGGRDTP